MGKFEVPENPEYTEDIRKFETTDPGHADLLNAVVQALVNNEAFLKKMAEHHIGDNKNPHGLTPENIGAPSNEYIADHFVPDYVSRSNGGTISSKGWYRIAQAKGGEYGASCVVSVKRSYNLPAPEYQKVQIVDSYHSNKIIPIVSFTGNDGRHLFTKIRKVHDSVNSISYIEIYQDVDTSPNGVMTTVTDALNVYVGKWEAIKPVATLETIEGVKVLATLDLPANFDSDYLAKKDGSNVNGTWSNLIAGKALKDGNGNSFENTYARKNWIYKGHIKYKGGEKVLDIGDYSELVFLIALSGEDSYTIIKTFNIPSDSLWDYTFGKDIKIDEDLSGIHISRRSNVITITNNYPNYYVGIYAR